MTWSDKDKVNDGYLTIRTFSVVFHLMQPKLSVGWSECVQSGQSVLTLFREFRVNLQDKTVPGFHFAETD